MSVAFGGPLAGYYRHKWLELHTEMVTSSSKT